MIGQQLHGDGMQDRGKHARVARGTNNVHALGFHEVTVAIRKYK